MAIRWRSNKKKKEDKNLEFTENYDDYREEDKFEEVLEETVENNNEMPLENEFNKKKIKNEKVKKESSMENKTHKVNWTITLIIATLLSILSVGLVSTYPLIEKNANEYAKENYSMFNNGNLRDEIYGTTYGIYFDMIEKQAHNEGKVINPATEFFTLTQNHYSKEESNYDDIMKEDENTLNSYVKDKIDSLNTLGNLNVYAMNSASDTVFTTNTDQAWLLETLAKNPAAGDVSRAKEYFRFYVVMRFDDRGKLTIGDTYGEDDFRVRQELIHYSNEFSAYRNIYNEYEIKPVKNMTYVYAVPKVLKYEDSIYYNDINRDDNIINMISPGFISIGLAITFLLGLIIPFKYSRNILGFNKFRKIPLEINLLGVFFYVPIIVSSGYMIIAPTIEGVFQQNFLGTNVSYLNSLVYIINLAFWFAIYGFLFFELVYIKYMFNTGFKNYLNKHVLIYKFKEVIFARIKKFARYVKSIDLNKKSDKFLLILIGINFVIVSLLCSVWFFGILGVFVYSALLFYFGRKYINKWKKDYNKVLEKTKSIADGNLEEVKKDKKDDYGFFNPLAEELNDIQRGFKNAVDEEVKSQRMKTELISNVSHDLKTPLTSIIAYVDLLKDEQDEDKRRAYLETLDKKSQRLKFLIEDLFEVSKATSGNVSLNIMNVDISYLMKQAIVELDDKISEAGLDVRLNLPDHKVILPLDSQRTYRVFENLIVNVVKYAMPNSRVYVDLNDSETDVEITIKNISADEITFNVNEISDRFVRGDKSRNTEGSGLGLAIVKSFIELQGGSFKVDVDGDLFKAIINFKKN
ncbi:histidine kinase dimerization/phospho-acceptor domain-containing protein [Clostridium sp. B9]|uniref:histidine kinase dimerization/phospho-acceptor domain-containing protein n=1 Tax=Clostridium sp. B9 TaxID=3423224 RepID=UPI003D2F3654